MPAAAAVAYRVSHGGGSESELPPLVFIHGSGGTSLHWPPQLRRLPGLDVYALDLPGHGDSGGVHAATIAENSRSVLDWQKAMGLGPCVFAGHSMGGAIALTLALDHSRAVDGLVLVGTGARLRVHPDILSLTGSGKNYPLAVHSMIAWFFQEDADENLLKLGARQMGQVPPEVLHADFLACDRFDVMSRVGEIACPALILCGSEDRLTPPKYSHYLAEHLRDSSLFIVNGSGHMVMLEQPEVVAKQIAAFIKGRWSEGRNSLGLNEPARA